MAGVIKTLTGTDSGISVQYEEIDSPNHNPRIWNGKFVKPSLIVIHTAECSQTPQEPENLATWDAGASRPQASWHFAVGNQSITCSVPIELLAWHAFSVNPYSIGIEHAGHAAQTVEDWANDYSIAELALSVNLCTVLCESLQIPVRIVSADELKANHHAGIQSWGICGHDTVTKALAGSHVDPGPNFPWDNYISQIATSATGAPTNGPWNS
jgi:N-acetyl-anhydromuramyl-L-alanine amidase AmpD